MPLPVGVKLGHYEILSLLGQGGMGEVYRAKDTKLDRQVAIKVLPAALARDPERLARFEREAKVLASLDHPNVGHIYGIVDSADSHGLVLALIQGPTLEDRIAAGPVPLDEAVAIAKQIIEALEYAHDRGVVHRDLKPANVKITPEGVVKVLDFGLAKVLEDEPPPSSLANSPTLTLGHTRTGVILGTAAYMSPEQAVGRPVDRRSDIFSFGAVLYEMLTGKRAFPGATTPDVLEAVVKNDPDWLALPVGTPGYLRRLLERMLAKDRKQRLQAIGEARIALENPRTDEPEPATVPMQSRYSWVGWAVAVIALTGLGVGWWRTTQPGEPKPLMRLDADLSAEVSPDSGEGPTLAIAPDGSRLVFVARGSDGKDHLALRLLDSAQTTVLADTEGGAIPFFSPDSRWVAFFAGGKLKKVSVEGGKAITLCDARNPRGGSWGEDGNILFAPENRVALSRVSSSGGEPKPATVIDAKNGEITNRFPQVLPGGEAFLFQSRTAEGTNVEATIQVQSIKTGRRKTLVTGGSYARYLPSGHLVYMHLGALYAAPMDLKRLELTGPASPVLEDVRFNGNGYAHFDFAPSGTLVYIAAASTKERLLSWLDVSGTPALVRGVPPGHYMSVHVSPDGNRLALLASDGGDASFSTYEWAQDRISQVASFKGVLINGRYVGGQDFGWAADSKHLVFKTETNQLSGAGIYWMRSDGAGEPQRLLPGAAWVLGSLSPDGKRMGYWSRVPPYGLWTLPLDLADPDHPKPGNPEPLLKSNVEVRGPTFSPDGRWVGYSSYESVRLEAYVRPFPGPGGKWQVSTEGAGTPNWLQNGHELFYRGSGGRVWIVDYSAKGDSFAASPPRLWSEKALPIALDAFDWMSDGKRLAVLVPTTQEDTKPPTHIVFLLNFFDELRRRAPVAK